MCACTQKIAKAVSFNKTEKVLSSFVYNMHHQMFSELNVGGPWACRLKVYYPINVEETDKRHIKNVVIY